MGDINFNEMHNLINEVKSNPNLNETARKELFISFLPRIFPEEDLSWINNFTIGSESFVKTRKTSFSNTTSGFIDTLHGQVIIEFKRNMSKPNIAKGKKELKKYTAALWSDKGAHTTFSCFLTDILEWRIYKPILKTKTNSKNYNGDMVKLIRIESIKIDSHNINSKVKNLCYLIKNIIFENKLMDLNAINLRRYFGLESKLYSFILPEIKNIVNNAKSNDEVRLSIKLWEKHQSYNKDKFDIDLYIRHTYLVILSRLILAASLSKEDYKEINDNTIIKIIKGDYFDNKLRLINFVDKDFFGWIFKNPWIDKLIKNIRLIYHELRKFNFDNISHENVIRLIYDEMISIGGRNELGQFSTPDYLVDEIINNLFDDKIRKEEIRFLDPACGTGSFIRSVLEKTRKELESKNISKKNMLLKLIDSTAGIDVDPVSVILAKTLWALTLKDLIVYSDHAIEIPIYHADSFFIASNIENDSKNEIYKIISFDDIEIEVPIRLFDDIRLFDKFINWCNEISKIVAQKMENGENEIDKIKKIDKQSIYNVLGKNISNKINDIDEVVISARKLIKELAIRIKEKRNGIWAFVLKNSYKPSLLAGRFNYIATNPPWLTMSSLSSVPKDYKDNLESKAEYFNIKPGGSSHLHTEISTTFVLHNVEHFLADNGNFAFVLPRSIFDANNHDLFRQEAYKDKVFLNIDEVWDLREIDNLFKMNSCVIFGEKTSKKMNKNKNEKKGIIWSKIKGKKNYEEKPLRLVRKENRSAWALKEISIGYDGSLDYYVKEFKQGADLMPRTTQFIDIKNDKHDQKLKRVETSKTELQNPHIKKYNKRFEGLTEDKYIFRTLTSKYLLPFFMIRDNTPLVLLPIEFNKGEIEILSDEQILKRGDTNAYKWFKRINDIFKNNGEKLLQERINIRNKLTNQICYNEKKYIVHSGMGGKIPCAGIQKIYEDRYKFVADQTTYVYATNNENEAYYLSGIINSEIIPDIISDFQSKGQFGERHIHKEPFYYIPKYESNDKIINEISRIAKDLENRVEKIVVEDEYISEINKRLQNRRRKVKNKIKEMKCFRQLNKSVKNLLQINI